MNLESKQTIVHRYRNEINTVNQLQLNYFTNIHLLIPRFINILCVVNVKLNTLTECPIPNDGGLGICLRM